MQLTAAVSLSAAHVTLEPLAARHAADLREAVCDGRLWDLPFTAVPQPGGISAEIERRLALHAAGSMLPFAVIERASARAVGMTAYMHADHEQRRLEIGSTWYRACVQRTALNTECKRLLLGHAFEVLQCIAVEFRTGSRNLRSRAAIERLGAAHDGILRSHQRYPDRTLRDTYVYSVTAPEWPAVKARLAAMGGGPSSSSG